jgi:hypothetical protein
MALGIIGFCLFFSGVASVMALCLAFSIHLSHLELSEMGLWGPAKSTSYGGRGDGSVAKSTGCFSRGPGFNSQHLYGSSLVPVT